MVREAEIVFGAKGSKRGGREEGKGDQIGLPRSGKV